MSKKIRANFHSHCHYCDGKEKPETFIKAALAAGFTAYGFSSHTPLAFDSPWSMQASALVDYCSEIDALKSKYQGQIEIYRGLELDYLPKFNLPSLAKLKQMQFDYFIGSIHYLGYWEGKKLYEIDGATTTFKAALQENYEEDIELLLTSYFKAFEQMLVNFRPDIVGHLDKIKIHNAQESFFSESAPFYYLGMKQLLKLIAEQKLILEVNTRGWYKGLTLAPYPSWPIIRKAVKMGIPLMLNADTHQVAELNGQFKEALYGLYMEGVRELVVFEKGHAVLKPIDLFKDFER